MTLYNLGINFKSIGVLKKQQKNIFICIQFVQGILEFSTRASLAGTPLLKRVEHVVYSVHKTMSDPLSRVIKAANITIYLLYSVARRVCSTFVRPTPWRVIITESQPNGYLNDYRFQQI